MERATLRKAALYLIPSMFLLYIVAFLYRVNVGFAALLVSGLLGLCFRHRRGLWTVEGAMPSVTSQRARASN